MHHTYLYNVSASGQYRAGSVSTDEYYDAIVNSSTFSSLIAKLPKIEDLTIDSKGSIEEARKLYDGLSDYGKQFINASDYSKASGL